MMKNGCHGKGGRKAGGTAGAVSYLVKGLLVIMVLAVAAAPQAARGEYFLSTWGSLGSGDGQFNYPTDVAVDAVGNVYVTDTYNWRIQKFNSTGGLICKWGSFGSGDGQFKEAMAQVTGNL